MINIEVVKRKFFEALKSFLQLMLAWLIILIVIAAFELLFNGFTRAFPESILEFVVVSVWNNLMFWFKTGGYLLPIFIILYFIQPKLATGITITLLFLFSILELLLINYFNTSLLPLGSDLFGYSVNL